MLRAHASALAALAIALAACDDAGLQTGCSTNAECPEGSSCVSGACASDAPRMRLDTGIHPDARVFVLLDGGPRDAGGVDAAAADAGPDAAAPDATSLDASPLDAAPRDGAPADATSQDAATQDAGAQDAATQDAATQDAAAQDAAAQDAAVRDATAPDATAPADAAPADAMAPPDAMAQADATAPDAAPPPDSGVRPDSGAPDSGVSVDAGPVARGIYTYRRVLPMGLLSNVEYTRLAISHSDRTLVFSERYDRVRAMEISTETASISVALPKVSNENIRVSSIRYANDDAYVLIAATAFITSNTVEGRLYVAGPHLEGLVEITSARAPGINFESLTVDAQTGATWVLGYRRLTSGGYNLWLQQYDPAMRRLMTPIAAVTSAGCEGVAVAEDGIGGRGPVFVCGLNGGNLGNVDRTGAVNLVTVNVGNTSRISARPQGDYALAIQNTSPRLYRFERGTWTTGFNTPNPGPYYPYGIVFNDDGSRALIWGSYNGSVAIMREFRHDLYSTAELTDVSIPNFNVAPWLAPSGATIDEAAYRPRSDCGFAVGGCNTVSGCRAGYLIAFRVENGRGCD